jgi:hypothetical protein
MTPAQWLRREIAHGRLAPKPDPVVLVKVAAAILADGTQPPKKDEAVGVAPDGFKLSRSRSRVASEAVIDA